MKYFKNKFKLLKLLYIDDEEFIKYYQKTRAKGLLKFIIKNIIIAVIVVIIVFSIARNSTFQTLEVIIFGVILGITVSLVQWSTDFDRYSRLEEKKK